MNLYHKYFLFFSVPDFFFAVFPIFPVFRLLRFFTALLLLPPFFLVPLPLYRACLLSSFRPFLATSFSFPAAFPRMPSARFLLPGIFPLSCFPPFFLFSSFFYPSPPFLFPLLAFSALFLPFPARLPALPLPPPRRSLSPSGFSRSPPRSTKKERPESALYPPVCPRRTTRPAKAENSNPIKIRIMSPPDRLRQLLKSAP